MSKNKWEDFSFARGGDYPPLWEYFHENSKLNRYSFSRSDYEVLKHLCQLEASQPYIGFPTTSLPRTMVPLKASLVRVILSRKSARKMFALPLKLREIATILRLSYGVTRRKSFSGIVRSLRVVPSAGALYPLEVFIRVNEVETLESGIYHYNPVRHHVRLIQDNDIPRKLKKCFLQELIDQRASLLIFITAIFQRSVFKYGERGYRFTLLEAGHMAQNINLVSSAMGLACLNVGGFFDREVDALLNLDGITQSTIYIVAIGRCRNAQAQS